MKAYQVKTIVPTLSSVCYLSQFKNFDLIESNKFISSNDDYGLSLYLEKFVKELKNNFDKAFGLINLRMINIGNEIKIKVYDKNNTPITIKIDLRNLLIKLLTDIQTPISDFIKNDLKISFTLPDKLYYKNIISFLYSIVDIIEIKNYDIIYKNLNSKDKKKLLLKLKPDIIKEIKDHIKDNQKKYSVIKIEYDDKKIDNNISFYDNSFFYFIKFIYKFNLPSIYNKLYLTCKNLNLNYSDFNNLTPSETDMLVAIYKKNNSIK